MRHAGPYWLLWCREAVFGLFRFWGYQVWAISGSCVMDILCFKPFIYIVVLAFSNQISKSSMKDFGLLLHIIQTGMVTSLNYRIITARQCFRAKTPDRLPTWLWAFLSQKAVGVFSLWYQREPIKWVFPYYKITSMCKNYHNVLDAILKASNVQTNSTKVIKNEN